MALSPELELEFDTEQEVEIETSRTYRIDFENKRITNEMISGLDAVRQFVILSLRFPRFAYSMFSANIGSELEELIKDEEATIALKKTEIPRLIEEALIYDERIDAVTNFTIEHVDDAFHVNFTVESNEGALEFEEVI